MSKMVLASKKEKRNFKNTVIKDENGYYKVTFGAFNTFNKSGIYYNVPDINKILGPGSLVANRINEGILIAEKDHPDVSEFIQNDDISGLSRRTIKLDPDNKCAHIKKIEIENTGRVEPGFKNPIYKIYGWVKPEGPKKAVLEEALENPDENVYFSVRSLVKQRTVGNIIVRDVLLVSTWDYVYDGGVHMANQWNAAGLESAMDVVVTDNDLKNIVVGFEGHCKDGKCVIQTLEDVLNRDRDAVDIIMNW